MEKLVRASCLILLALGLSAAFRATPAVTSCFFYKCGSSTTTPGYWCGPTTACNNGPCFEYSTTYPGGVEKVCGCAGVAGTSFCNGKVIDFGSMGAVILCYPTATFCNAPKSCGQNPATPGATECIPACDCLPPPV